MLYIVQENIFREENYDKIFDSLNRLQLDYEVVKFNENGEIDIKTDRQDLFVFGSVRLARVSTERNWIPGSFYGNNHDYEIYSKYYKENLVNFDCKIQELSDDIIWETNEMKFIRPSKDSKVFNGALYTKIKWEGCLDNIRDKNKGILPKVNIQVNKPKRIYKEARIWIVDGKIVTSSNLIKRIK